jgi:hypothetical protein
MADNVAKICMDIYRKLEKSRVLNVTERLQIPDNLEICYLYNLQWKYVKKYISIQTSIFLFVSSVLKAIPNRIFVTSVRGRVGFSGLHCQKNKQHVPDFWLDLDWFKEWIYFFVWWWSITRKKMTETASLRVTHDAKFPSFYAHDAKFPSFFSVDSSITKQNK